MKKAIDCYDGEAIILIDKYYMNKYDKILPYEIKSELDSYYNYYLSNKELCDPAIIYNYCIELIFYYKTNAERVLIILCRYYERTAYINLLKKCVDLKL